MLRTTPIEMHFAGAATDVRQARNFAADLAADLAVDLAADDEQTAAAVRLIVSELATNAVVHAGSGFRVRVSRAEVGIRVEVHDPSPRPPVVRRPEPGTIGGRGLAIVERLARAWGCEPTSAGKIVWAEVGPR